MGRAVAGLVVLGFFLLAGLAYVYWVRTSLGVPQKNKVIQSLRQQVLDQDDQIERDAQLRAQIREALAGANAIDDGGAFQLILADQVGILLEDHERNQKLIEGRKRLR